MDRLRRRHLQASCSHRPTGKDEGKGGKYLVLPPGYDGDVGRVLRAPFTDLRQFLRSSALHQPPRSDRRQSDEVGREGCKVYRCHRPREGRFTATPVLRSARWFPRTVRRSSGCIRSSTTNRQRVRPRAPREARVARHRERQAVQPRRPDAEDLRPGRRRGRGDVPGHRLRLSRRPGRRLSETTLGSPYVTNNSTFYQDDYINLEARTVSSIPGRRHHARDGGPMAEGKGSGIRRPTRTATATLRWQQDLQGQRATQGTRGALLGRDRVRPWSRCEIQSQPYRASGSQQDRRRYRRRRLGRHLLRDRRARRHSGAERGQDPA